MILALAIILTLMLLAVVYFDVTAFIIPNKLNLAFIALWPVFVAVSPEPIEWWWSIAVFAAFLAVGMLVFMTGIMGGGDVKLLIVLSLWIGWQPAELGYFGIWVTLSGGILALFLLISRAVARRIYRSEKDRLALPKVFRKGEPIPYGLAIAYAFGYMLWTDKIYGLVI